MKLAWIAYFSVGCLLADLALSQVKTSSNTQTNTQVKAGSSSSSSSSSSNTNTNTQNQQQQFSGPKTTKAWFVKPHHAAYGGGKGTGKGDLSVQTNKNQNAALTANKANLNAQVNSDGGKQWKVGKTSQDAAEAQSAKGVKANIDRSKKAQGERSASAGKYNGQLLNTKKGNDNNWNMKSNQGQNLDTVMHGTKVGDASFDAQGSKGHKYNVKPADQSKSAGTGTINMDGRPYQYKNSRTGNDDTETAQLTNVQSKRFGTHTYTCQGQKQGISNCVDDTGLKVGEVVSQPDGTVILKKTVSKGVDVPVYKGHAVKNQNGKSVVVINDGLYQAQAGNFKQRDCMADFGKSGTSKVKIEKPFSFKWNSQKSNSNGQTEYQFPDCVTFGGKITLPAGVDANRLALQFDVNVLPAGKLKCVDPGSCNKDCYYCNFCSNSRKADVMGNSDGSNACNMKGGGTYPVSVTACPPPQDVNKAVCSGFTKSDPTYFQRKGDIQARLLIYERPADEATLKNTYYNTIATNKAARSLLAVQYAAAKKNFINAQNPTDFDLAEYYVTTSKGKQELVGCVEGTTNYTMSGQKVNTAFLLEVGSVAAAPKSLFDQKPCPAVDAINTQQAQADAAVAAQNKPAGNNLLNQFGSFFGGGNGR